MTNARHLASVSLLTLAIALGASLPALADAPCARLASKSAATVTLRFIGRLPIGFLLF